MLNLKYFNLKYLIHFLKYINKIILQGNNMFSSIPKKLQKIKVNVWSSPSKQCHGIFSNRTQPKVLLLDCFNKVGHLINITPSFSKSQENKPILKTLLSSFLPTQPCKALLGKFFGTKFGSPQDCCHSAISLAIYTLFYSSTMLIFAGYNTSEISRQQF